jgi:hypothetical protein
MDPAHPTQAFLQLRRHFPLTVIGEPPAASTYVKINVANENLTSYLAVIKSFYVCRYSCFENTPINFHSDHL